MDKYADIRLKTFMNIIFSLGCRREEACGLRWCDIDFKNKEVNFNYANTSSIPLKFLEYKKDRDKKLNIISEKDYNRVRTKDLKTENSYRTNYLSDLGIECLKKYYKFKVACGIEVDQNDHIFTNYREGRNISKRYIQENEDIFSDNRPIDPNKLSGQWRSFKKLHFIKDVDLHRIRHTVANVLEKKGVPKKDIAKMLGNTERVLEEYYTHVDVNELKRLRNQIDRELFNGIEYISLNIDLVAKIVNEYPMSSLNQDELKLLDLILHDSVNTDNYNKSIQIAKDIILTSDGGLNYFIDDNIDRLDIKLETYKRFNENDYVKIQREKDISIQKDILSL